MSNHQPRRHVRALLFQLPVAAVLSLAMSLPAATAAETGVVDGIVPLSIEDSQGGFVVDGESWSPQGDGEMVVRDAYENSLLTDAELARIQAIADTEFPGSFRGALTGYDLTVAELDTEFVRTPIPDAPISSPFGPRWGSFHYATDYPAAQGTPVYAIANGVVSHVMTESMGGNMVVVDHMVRGERFQSAYAHLSSQSVVPGQVVTSETEIGLVGSTGFSTGPHLHLEIRTVSGVQIDPAAWLVDGSLEYGPDPSTVAPPTRPPGGEPESPAQPQAREETVEEPQPEEPEDTDPAPEPEPESTPEPEPEPEEPAAEEPVDDEG